MVVCVKCGFTLDFCGYDPRKEWNMEGKLCKKCYNNLAGVKDKPFPVGWIIASFVSIMIVIYLLTN